MTAHEILVTIGTAAAIVIFLGMAIYVGSRNPYQSVTRIFTLLCLTLATIYLSSLFMVAWSGLSHASMEFFLHIKWIAIAVSPTLYLHLLFFFFDPSWKRYRRRLLRPAYMLTAGLILTHLFTDLVIVGSHYHPPPHIIGYNPGTLMPAQAGFFMLQVTGSIFGLIISYRRSQSVFMRRQLLYLLWSAGLIFLAGSIHWIIVLRDADHIPHELPDALLLVAAILFVRAVGHYGTFIGRPLVSRTLFFTAVTAIFGLAAFYLTLVLDQWLTTYTRFPYPPATGILIIVLASGYPMLSRWGRRVADRWLFRDEFQQRILALGLSEALAEVPDPEQLQPEILDTFCAILGVRNGYVAISHPELPSDFLTVQTIYGESVVQLNDRIYRLQLPDLSDGPQWVIPSLASLPETHRQDIVLFCPLTIDQEVEGVLALGEKRDGKPFTAQEMTLCSELIKQLNLIGRMMRLRERCNAALDSAHSQNHMLQQLSEEVITSAHQTFTTWREGTPSLEIRTLGPLLVTRDGKRVTEAAWGSEKAKGMLAYLLWKSPNGATREEVSTALWPDRPFEETANVFHVTLHRLRRVLQPKSKNGRGSDYIQHDRGRYRFNIDAPHWLDVATFEKMVIDNDPVTLKTAIDLYRGCYLEDSAWALPAEVEVSRRRLEQLYTDALRRLAAQVNEREAAIYLEKLLIIEPTDETAYQALVMNYFARGRNNLAQQQIMRWQQIFEDLDLTPSPEIAAMRQMIKPKNGHGLQKTKN